MHRPAGAPELSPMTGGLRGLVGGLKARSQTEEPTPSDTPGTLSDGAPHLGCRAPALNCYRPGPCSLDRLVSGLFKSFLQNFASSS